MYAWYMSSKPGAFLTWFNIVNILIAYLGLSKAGNNRPHM